MDFRSRVKALIHPNRTFSILAFSETILFFIFIFEELEGMLETTAFKSLIS